MELGLTQYLKIKDYLPRQRGNVKSENIIILNALLYVLKNGCKWRSLPDRFGNWSTVYKRLNRWCKLGVLKRVFEGLQKESICSIKVEFVALGSTCSKVHPNGCGALKKMGSSLLVKQREDGIQNFIWYPQMISALDLKLSAGNEHDATEGRKLLVSMKKLDPKTKLLMDKAYEDNETRETAEK